MIDGQAGVRLLANASAHSGSDMDRCLRLYTGVDNGAVKIHLSHQRAVSKLENRGQNNKLQPE